ncbi:adenylyltransferase/cytidyltransferase family protein [Anaerobiospirillum thomasii]|uniref:Glycerol-3-phosphate cytidylyltransferase n=1 Tax=Anaerobiospirillum thomasii TaxID=179995 RepID=A0A2X0VMV2_9GAMM|nr:adenylyltransferase/cytidyltransferase family protein [Anaerobiospirillum thomasii]SPT70838.1 Glycerol-3-phosphate cytidylyltransferase [Anaerobiospirillum thomasii]
MKKVITYGTFDLLHIGHINILKRAKALGDYLIVGVTDDSYDISRGKLNVTQSVVDRIKAVEKTGFADEIIIEKRDGQKINDIIRYDIDVIVLGSDWIGKIDYLKKYCEVVYLPRTNNISSTMLRTGPRVLTVALISDSKGIIDDFNECRHIGEIDVSTVYTTVKKAVDFFNCSSVTIVDKIDDICNSNIDIAIVDLHTNEVYELIIRLLESKKSVFIKPNIYLANKDIASLFAIAESNKVELLLTPLVHFNPLVQQIKSLIHSNYIGTLQSIIIEQSCSERNLDKYLVEGLSLIADWSKLDTSKIKESIKIFDYSSNGISVLIMSENKYYILKINTNKFMGNSIKCSGEYGCITSKCKINKLHYFKIITNSQRKIISDQEIVYSTRFGFIELIKNIKKTKSNFVMNYDTSIIKNVLEALVVFRR